VWRSPRKDGAYPKVGRNSAPRNLKEKKKVKNGPKVENPKVKKGPLRRKKRETKLRKRKEK